MRSDIASASSWSCVTYRNVIPTSRWMPLSSTCICLRSLRSSAPSGSSSRSTAGRLTSARASATRCFCPPESSRGLAALAAPQLHQLQRLAHARADLGRVHLAALEPEGHVVRHVEVLEQRVALEDRVHVALVGRHGLHRLALEEDAALGGLLEPGHHPQRRGLAAARRAEQREELALLDLEVEVPARPWPRRSAWSCPRSGCAGRAHAPSLPTSTPRPLSRAARAGAAAAAPARSPASRPRA